jgi:ectoine hydroxylase-related dioxygenase (phytanoyl-CoA dioxygenase family)
VISFERAPAQVAVLCYLSDTNLDTGALRVLPGSHRKSVPLHRLLPEAHSDESTALTLGHPAMVDQPGQVSLEVRAGDAVLTDYRLLHGTHANVGVHRRDCVLLSFAPNWSYLPEDLRSHLIQHPALPQRGEDTLTATTTYLLPSFDGPRCDLPLNRNAPAQFDITATAPT